MFKILIRIGSGISDVYAAQRDDGGLFAIKCSAKCVDLKSEYLIATRCWPHPNLLKCLAYGERKMYNEFVSKFLF